MNTESEAVPGSSTARETVHDTPVSAAQQQRILDVEAARERLVLLAADIGGTLAGGGPVHEVLQRCTDILVRRLGVACARLWTLAPGERVLQLRAASGEQPGLEGRMSRVAVGRLRVGMVAQTAHPYQTSDLAHDSRPDDREWAEREGVTGFAGHPLVAGGRVVGVIAVFARTSLLGSTLEELAVVSSAIAQYVDREQVEHERSVLLERERDARARAGEAVRRQAFLAHASLALDASANTRAALEQTARLAVPFLADWCLVELVEEGEAVSRFVTAADQTVQAALDELTRGPETNRRPSSLTTLVLRTREPALFPDSPDLAGLLSDLPREDLARLRDALPARSLIVVALRARGQLFGSIALVSADPGRRFNEMDLSLAQDFARRCGLALDNLRLVADAQRKVAERRWAEEALLRSEEHLRQATKMEAVGRLAGGIAHDFNNILTVILGCAELLQTQELPTGPARELLEEIQRSGERAARLTGQLLTFGRKSSALPGVVDVNVLLNNLRGMLGRLISEDIQLGTKLDSAPAPVWADPGQLEQVIVNLVVNARDAMPHGGRLTIETRNVELDASWAHLDVRPGPHVLLAVSDTGLGMSDEVRAHLFEPFFTTKSVGEGTGLGLAITYGIVRRAGGHIDVHSEPGKGTTFRVYLPRTTSETQRPEPRSGSAGVPIGTETVLLVEDDEVIRGLVARALRALGYTVLEAGDGDEGLRVAAGHSGAVDLLLTDVVMPQLGGRELAGRLLASHPGLRVLYLSGYAQASVFHGTAAGGTGEFLEKPFTPESLARKVRRVLDG